MSRRKRRKKINLNAVHGHRLLVQGTQLLLQSSFAFCTDLCWSHLSIPRKRKEHNQNKICILYFRKNNASRSLSGMRSCSQETSFRLVGFVPWRALLSGNLEQQRKLEERGGNSGTYWRLCCLFLLWVKEEKTANKRPSAVATAWCRVRFTKCLLLMQN